jgi:dynactin 1
MNEELQETAREVELQLREDVDMANERAAEAQRKLDAIKESIADYEETINKFREHVAKQQVSSCLYLPESCSNYML